MVGAYARMTPAELNQALQDPQWAAEHLMELAESAYPAQDSVDTDRYVDIDKAWNVIWFLLDAAKAPIDVVAGGAPVSDEDLGYGPARYLTSGEVELAASYLQAMPWEELAGYFDPAQMTADGIYPHLGRDRDFVLTVARAADRGASEAAGIRPAAPGAP